MQDETMKKKNLRRRKPLSNSVKVELWHELHKLSDETKINKSILLDEAIELLLRKYERPIPGENDEKTS
jgi:hypothetical protein